MVRCGKAPDPKDVPACGRLSAYLRLPASTVTAAASASATSSGVRSRALATSGTTTEAAKEKATAKENNGHESDEHQLPGGCLLEPVFHLVPKAPKATARGSALISDREGHLS